MQRSRLFTSIDIGTFKITTLIGQYFDTGQKLNIIGAASVPASGFKKAKSSTLNRPLIPSPNQSNPPKEWPGLKLIPPLSP